MILTLSNDAPAYNGRLGGIIVTSFGPRAVARTRSRPASKRQRQSWSPPFSLATARTTWATLSPGEQEAWDDYAAAFVTWPIEGSPRYATGLDSFANYFTVLRLIDPLATIPDAPLDGVTWQPQPKFFQFADWEDDVYTLKAETDFEENTTILFSSVPPSKTIFNGEWYGEKIVGSHLFEYGLYENDWFDGLHFMIEDQFGTIDPTMKIWTRCWEVQTDTGNIRVLKDPCTVDPTTTPPAEDLVARIYNDYFEEVSFGTVDALNIDGEFIGAANISTMAAFETFDSGFIFDEPYGIDDVTDMILLFEWSDGSGMYEEVPFDGSNPWEYTVAPQY